VRAPHGTVIGYQKNDDGHVEPIFKSDQHSSRQLEKDNEGLIALFQNGIFRYMQEYTRAVQMLGATALDTRPYALEMLEKMIRYPTRSEADMLFKLKNISDLGSDLSVVLGQRSSSNGHGSLNALRQELRRSFWKHGTLALKASLPIRWFWMLVNDALRHVRSRQLPLDEGIAFREPHQVQSKASRSIQSTTQNKKVENQRKELDKRLFQKHLEVARSIYLRQKHHAQSGNDFLATKPLTIVEALHARIIFHAARLLGKMTGRHAVYRLGLPIKPLLISHMVVPFLASRNWLLRMYQYFQNRT
jgi:hypothetical protein